MTKRTLPWVRRQDQIDRENQAIAHSLNRGRRRQLEAMAVAAGGDGADEPDVPAPIEEVTLQLQSWETQWSKVIRSEGFTDRVAQVAKDVMGPLERRRRAG